MIACFKKSVLIRQVVIALGVVLGVIIFVGSGDTPAVIKGLYAIVAFAFGAVLGNIFALRYAVSNNKKLLDILNAEGNPEKFIREYSEVPANVKDTSAEFIITSNYLSNGYFALGDFEKALKILLPLEKKQTKHHQLAVKALVLNNITQNYLWMEDLEKANEKIQELEGLKAETEGRNPSVHQNLTYNLRLYKEHMKINEGKEGDLDYIKEEIDLSNNIIHKNNMKLLLAKGLFIENKTEEAKEILKELRAMDNDLFSVKKAKEMLEK